jgi:hypothetical protein
MMTAKVVFVAALSFWVVATGCSRKVRAETRTISASSDASGNHPGSAQVDGPVMVTCVSATGDGGGLPPACIIDGPGGSGVVKIGDQVTVGAAGKVVLTCQGQGTLSCTARIEEQK